MILSGAVPPFRPPLERRGVSPSPSVPPRIQETINPTPRAETDASPAYVTPARVGQALNDPRSGSGFAPSPRPAGVLPGAQHAPRAPGAYPVPHYLRLGSGERALGEGSRSLSASYLGQRDAPDYLGRRAAPPASPAPDYLGRSAAPAVAPAPGYLGRRAPSPAGDLGRRTASQAPGYLGAGVAPFAAARRPGVATPAVSPFLGAKPAAKTFGPTGHEFGLTGGRAYRRIKDADKPRILERLTRMGEKLPTKFVYKTISRFSKKLEISAFLGNHHLKTPIRYNEYTIEDVSRFYSIGDGSCMIYSIFGAHPELLLKLREKVHQISRPLEPTSKFFTQRDLDRLDHLILELSDYPDIYPDITIQPYMSSLRSIIIGVIKNSYYQAGVGAYKMRDGSIRTLQDIIKKSIITDFGQKIADKMSARSTKPEESVELGRQLSRLAIDVTSMQSDQFFKDMERVDVLLSLPFEQILAVILERPIYILRTAGEQFVPGVAPEGQRALPKRGKFDPNLIPTSLPQDEIDFMTTSFGDKEPVLIYHSGGIHFEKLYAKKVPPQGGAQGGQIAGEGGATRAGAPEGVAPGIYGGAAATQGIPAAGLPRGLAGEGVPEDAAPAPGVYGGAEGASSAAALAAQDASRQAEALQKRRAELIEAKKIELRLQNQQLTEEIAEIQQNIEDLRKDLGIRERQPVSPTEHYEREIISLEQQLRANQAEIETLLEQITSEEVVLEAIPAVEVGQRRAGQAAQGRAAHAAQRRTVQEAQGRAAQEDKEWKIAVNQSLRARINDLTEQNAQLSKEILKIQINLDQLTADFSEAQKSMEELRRLLEEISDIQRIKQEQLLRNQGELSDLSRS